jgi:hypothetical protein
MTYESLLNNSIYLRTRYSTTNELGEPIYTYSSSTTPTKCRMVPITVGERIENPGLFDDVRYTCYSLSSSTINTDSQILYQGSEYRVKESEFDSSFHHKKSLLVLIA